MSLLHNIPSVLQSAIYIVSNSLLYPVIIILLVLMAFVSIELGAFLFEGVVRRRSRKKGIPEEELKNGNRECLKAINSSSRFLQKFISELSGLKNDEFIQIKVEKLLQGCDEGISKRLEKTRLLTRIGPMFGLMGTLIPMGPALLALTEGDVNRLASNLIIAFGTTVVGLLVGSISYAISMIRERWYEHDMREMEYIAEMLFGGAK